jgi:hypothetical protein
MPKSTPIGESKAENLTLAAYLKAVTVNPGLIASFKCENPQAEEESKTSEEWAKAFEAQSNKKYE